MLVYSRIISIYMWTSAWSSDHPHTLKIMGNSEASVHEFMRLTEFGGWRYGGIYKYGSLQSAANSQAPVLSLSHILLQIAQKITKHSPSHRCFFSFSKALTASDTQTLWERIEWEGSDVLIIPVTIPNIFLYFSKRNFGDKVGKICFTWLKKSLKLPSLILNVTRGLTFNFK